MTDLTFRPIPEYHKAQDGLGDTPDTSAEWLYSQQREGLSDMMMSLSSDGPTVRLHSAVINAVLTATQLFFAFLALLNPSKLSMTQLAVLNQASTSLSYTLSSIVWDIDFWPGCFSRMMNVYTALDAKSKMKDGETPFPRPGYEESAGIGIEVRYVAASTAPCNSTHSRGPETYRSLILAANPSVHLFPMSRSLSNLDSLSSSLAPTEVENRLS